MLSTKVSIEQKIDLPEFIKAGIEVFVKRDDLIHPFISGNKWRKLKYNYQKYLETKCDGIVTFGGAFSNHIIATAAFCAHNKIKCIGIIRGERPEKLNHVLMLSMLWGMELKFVSRTEYRDKDIMESNWSKNNYFVIPEGGNNEEGVKGCAELISELGQVYDHILCASGTGCTVSGFVRGINKNKLPTICHSIAVLKEGDFINDVIRKYNPTANNFKVHTKFHGGGYAKTSETLLRYIHYFASQTGIMLDPIYTAKLVMAITNLIEDQHIKVGDRVLLIHTGGLTGLLSEKMLVDVQKNV